MMPFSKATEWLLLHTTNTNFVLRSEICIEISTYNPHDMNSYYKMEAKRIC